jgi:hypothetical protein
MVFVGEKWFDKKVPFSYSLAAFDPELPGLVIFI